MAAVASIWPSRPATAEVLTFEGQSVDYITQLNYAYGGLNWSDMFALNNSPTLDGTTGGYVVGAVSGTTIAYNPTGVGDVTSPAPFTFNSAYLTGAFNDGLNVTVEGWRSGGLLYTTSFTVDATGPTLHTFD